jgi:lysophospholipase L1-like esterase
VVRVQGQEGLQKAKAGTSRRVRRAAAGPLLALATLIALMALSEVGLRALVPRSRVLDPNGDAYWKVRFLEAYERSPQGARERNVRFHPVLGWAPSPGVQRPERGESTNSRGSRGSVEYAYERVPGVGRWVVLGDSFTYGLGVRDEEVWTAQVAHSLGAEVVNLGVNGFGTDQQVLSWLIEGLKYQPDGVVLAFYLPDFHRNALAFRELPKPRFVLEDGALRFEPLRISDPGQIADESRRVSLRRSWLGDAIALSRVRLRGEPEEQFLEKAALCRGLLRLLGHSVRTAGAELRIVLIPHHHYARFERAAEIVSLVEAAGLEVGAPVLDLTDAFASGSSKGDPLYDPAHQHWTAAGHRLAAQRIAAFLGGEAPAGSPASAAR